MGDMPPCTIEDDDGMSADRDLRADFGEMQGHGFGIGMGENQSRRFASFRTSCGKQVGGLVALIFGLPWPAAAPRPLAGQLALLTDPSFVRKPDFYRAFIGSVTDGISDQILEFFLYSAWISGSLLGCCGRALIRRKPSFLMSLDNPCS